MTELRKITVEVPDELIEQAQDYSGEGVTETVRQALRRYVSFNAQQKARELRGKVKFSLTLEEMRYDRE
jgi:metal-responsive CopG/Arc/MetJ family transcriptional regulator